MDSRIIINFTPGSTFLHRLTGTTKVRFYLCMLWFLIACWDIRLLIPILILAMAGVVSTKPYWKPIIIICIIVVWMNLFNLFLYFLFDPRIGELWTGTFTQFGQITGRFVLGYETMWYFLTRFLKLITSFAVSLLFILAITPSEFAAGLNSIRLPYKFCIIVELAFRYIPDLIRDFKEISISAQTRGSETDKRKVSIGKRLRGATMVLIPLVLSSFNRVGDIANAMDLRGFGKIKKRSWYCERPPKKTDKIVQVIGILFFLAGIYITLMRIFNPDNPQMWYPYNDLTTYNWRIFW